MLDGQGGDELFAGYHMSYGPYLRDLLTSLRLRELRREARAMAAAHDVGMRRVVRALVRASLPESIVWAAQARESGAAELLGPGLGRPVAARRSRSYKASTALRTHLGELVTKWPLPELLRYEDRNSMAHGIEARVPMLDHMLVELAFSLQGSDLIKNGVTKLAVRRGLSDLLPAEVAARTDKVGFVTPLSSWWRGDLGAFAQEVFSSRACRDRGFVDVDECLRRLRDPGSSGFELWRALNVELWAQAFLDSAQRASRETSWLAADPAPAAAARMRRA
jgi:asparagine synthase (glutamine-hydrolysing)